jgi:hypothetical protein
MKIEEGLTWTLPGRHSPPAAQLPSLALDQNTAQVMAQRQPTYLFVKIKRGVHPHLLLAHGRQHHAVLLFSSLAVDPSFIDGVTRLALEPYKSLDEPWPDLLSPLLNFLPRTETLATPDTITAGDWSTPEPSWAHQRDRHPRHAQSAVGIEPRCP